MYFSMGFPGGIDSKESACNAGDLDSIPQSGRSPGRGNDNPLQYSCLENPMNRGAWWATVRGVAKSWTQLSDWHLHITLSFLDGRKGNKRLMCCLLAIFRVVQKTCEVERLNKRFPVFCLFFVITFCCICLCLVCIWIVSTWMWGWNIVVPFSIFITLWLLWKQ